MPLIVDGDLLDQDVAVIVNPWNRNLLPWWLLLPSGVSGAIKRRGGIEPFRELRRAGLIPLGGAVATSAGSLSFDAIIHVAGIDLTWRASRQSVSLSVRSAMQIVDERGFPTVAFPIIGSGAGGLAPETSLQVMISAFSTIESSSQVRIVRYSNDANRTSV